MGEIELITQDEYLKARNIVKLYLKQKKLPFLLKGDIIEFNGFSKNLGKNTPKLTVGKKYEVLDIDNNYKYFTVPYVAIRDDLGVKRWYSSNSITNNFK